MDLSTVDRYFPLRPEAMAFLLKPFEDDQLLEIIRLVPGTDPGCGDRLKNKKPTPAKRERKEERAKR